jgi:hypothetical protein
LRLLAVMLGFIVATIGAVGVVAPSVLLDLGDSLINPTVLYIAAGVRVFFGAVLLWVAAASRTPKTLRVIGALLVLAGVFTPFFGIEHSREMVDWVLAQGLMFTRAWAGVAVGLGLFIVYATTGPR